MGDEVPTVTLLSEKRLTLGEGPTYDPNTDIAWWFDIVGCKLIEHQMGSGRERVHDLPFMASMLARVDADRQLVAAEDGLYLRNALSGRLTLHKPLEAENALTRSNDGRVHPCGALWIGTMGRKAEPQAGTIYWYREGEIRVIFPEIGIPNAISFSPDGRVGYFADTQIDTVFRVDLDPETGLPLHSPSVFLAPRHDEGSPDGAVVDAEGNIWCARWGGAALSVFSPEGKKLRSIPLPASQPTCPAFVGANADRVIVSSATQDLSQAQLAGEPEAGCTFLLDIAVKGRPEPDVML